jgi:hypothetical protein
MSKATMLAALLGMGLAVPNSAAAPAETDTSAVAASASAARNAPAGVEPGAPDEVRAAPFLVEGIDRGNRLLLVQSPDGSVTTISVATGAEGFDALAVGDRVSLDYFPASVLSLGSDKVAVDKGEAEATRASAPVLGAAGGRQLTAEARVTDVDVQAGTLAVKTVGGNPHALTVLAPEARRQLQSVHEGDHVTVTYTEAVAVGLHPAAED